MWLPLLSIDLKHRTCQLILQQKKNVCSISRETQLGFCSHGKLHANPCKAKVENSSTKKGKGNWEGYHKWSRWLFIDWVVAKKGIDFLPSSECYHHHRT